MPINTNFGVSGNMMLNRNTGLGNMRGPGATIMSPNQQTNDMIHQKVTRSVRFLHNAENRAMGLRVAIDSLGAAFAPSTAVSSNTDALKINSFTGSNLTELEVHVHQIATAQRNEGVGLNRHVPFTDYGTFEFEIEVDGETRRLSFNVGENETLTNQQFQQRMANTINNANIGLTASVTADGQTSSLNIVTRTTGAGEDNEPRFTLTDITGNAVELTGISNIAQEGQNALFTVGSGEQQSSDTNTVSLGNGINATLVEATDPEEPVVISLGQNNVAMQNSVRLLVNQFNALLETARDNAADRNTRSLLRQIEAAGRMSRRALADIGIVVGENGALSINAERMQTAAENGSLERFFTGGTTSQPNSFVSRITRISDNIIRNPMRHVSPNASRMPGFAAAWDAVQRGQDPTPPPNTSPFAAYGNSNDWLSIFLDSRR